MPELHIRVVIEHAAQEQRTTVTVNSSGEQFDPRSTDNVLSLQVMQTAAEKIDYIYDLHAEKPNKTVIQIKQE